MISLFGTIECVHRFAAFSLYTLMGRYHICFVSMLGVRRIQSETFEICSYMLSRHREKLMFMIRLFYSVRTEVGLTVKCRKVLQWEAFGG